MFYMAQHLFWRWTISISCLHGDAGVWMPETLRAEEASSMRREEVSWLQHLLYSWCAHTLWLLLKNVKIRWSKLWTRAILWLRAVCHVQMILVSTADRLHRSLLNANEVKIVRSSPAHYSLIMLGVEINKLPVSLRRAPLSAELPPPIINLWALLIVHKCPLMDEHLSTQKEAVMVPVKLEWAHILQWIL